MILYSEHKEVKEPVGYVCDVCGRKFTLTNTYERLYCNTVEQQMGIVRVLQPDGSTDLEEIHVCCWKCAAKAASRYNMRIELRIPSFGVFDKAHTGDIQGPEKAQETGGKSGTLGDMCFRGVDGDERYGRIGETICRYIQHAGADPVKLLTLAVVMMDIDKDMERIGGCDGGTKKM